jgi:hypothetical protein
MPSSTHIFGIRHHGPGSARSLRRALTALAPDLILVEGPPEAEPILQLAASTEMCPPVALLLYIVDEPKRASFYPFAAFSPEWSAIQYGLTHDVPIRFIDLPQAHQLAAEQSEDLQGRETTRSIRQDPLRFLAEAAGYADSERWWESTVEHRQNDQDVFVAIHEAMTALRQELGDEDDLRERQREAYMRQCLRKAKRDSFNKIAVVCGAWHGPALLNGESSSNDAALLTGLPKVKTSATWIPWTNSRLSYGSGYGAGIESPGWYAHLWCEPRDVTISWISKAAHLLREHDLDSSPAHIIEAVRMADTLSALRGKTTPGLDEMNAAIQAVFCFGSDLPMRLISEKLIVGDRMGTVPPNTPMVPLQRDFECLQKRLRLPTGPAQKVIDLDLRRHIDVEKSQLLHRSNILGIPWGRPETKTGTKGTFHEVWRLLWQPEFVIALIESAVWGNSVVDASESFAQHSAETARDLPTLTDLLERSLLADLPRTVQCLMERLQNESAVARDIGQLMDALGPLVNVVRYGNVRKTDTELVSRIVNGLLKRIAIGFPAACSSLDDEAAKSTLTRMNKVDAAVAVLQIDEYNVLWNDCLIGISELVGIHGLIAGRSTRILLDSGAIQRDAAATGLSRALGRASEPLTSAAWVEGFLLNSGHLLLLDEKLWSVVDDWITELHYDTFLSLLPLIRRTFATFTVPERRHMGERVKLGISTSANEVDATDGGFEKAKAESALPLIRQILGLNDAPGSVT